MMTIGQVIKCDKNRYNIQLKSSKIIIQAKISGSLKYQKIDIITGDWVQIAGQVNQDYLIIKRLDRTNKLKRPRISNLNAVFIVSSVKNPKLDFVFLTKMIIWIETKLQMTPTLIFTKMDLITPEEENIVQLINLYAPYYPIILINPTQQKTKIKLTQDTNVFLGRSGVGKSTLINYLKPELNLKTANVSTKTKLGKHQTTHNQIFQINNKLVADTPGFNNIKLEDITKENLLNNFVFFQKSDRQKCHFQPCYHDHEPKCNIKKISQKNKNQQFWLKIWHKIIH